jgi:hypothetical protein
MKILRSVLWYYILLQLLFLIGCATLEIASKKTIIEDVEKGEAPIKLYVITKDDNRYRFWSYEIKNDTLYGEGVMMLTNNERPYEGKIPMDNISHFEVVKYRVQTGWLIVAGGVVAIYLVSIIIAQ